MNQFTEQGHSLKRKVSDWFLGSPAPTMLLMLFMYDKQEAMHNRALQIQIKWPSQKDSGRVTVAFFWQPNKYPISQSINDNVKMYPDLAEVLMIVSSYCEGFLWNCNVPCSAWDFFLQLNCRNWGGGGTEFVVGQVCSPSLWPCILFIWMHSFIMHHLWLGATYGVPECNNSCLWEMWSQHEKQTTLNCSQVRMVMWDKTTSPTSSATTHQCHEHSAFEGEKNEATDNDSREIIKTLERERDCEWKKNVFLLSNYPGLPHELSKAHSANRTPGFTRTHGDPDPTYLGLSMESNCSACSSDSVTSQGVGSGSGLRMRKKRKQPTRLMTVRVMNTVRRSASETHVAWITSLKWEMAEVPMELNSMNSCEHSFLPTWYVSVSAPGTVYIEVSKE